MVGNAKKIAKIKKAGGGFYGKKYKPLKAKNDNNYDSIGIKHVYRIIATLRITEIIEQSGELQLCVMSNSGAQNRAYWIFMNSFNKLFTSVGMFLSDDSFVGLCDDFLNSDWNYVTYEEFRQKSLESIHLFRRFLFQMNVDGLYNPEITHKVDYVEDSWKGSI